MSPLHIRQNTLGAVLLTVSWVFFTTEMVTVRILAQDLSIAQIAVFRVTTQIILLFPIVIASRGAIIRTRKLGTHVLRAAFSSGGMVLFYLAFAVLPVALATTLTFTQAMFVTLLAALVLKETVGRNRIGAVIVGFVGVLVVMRPGFASVDPGMFIALFGALVAALLMIVTRSLSSTESRMTIMLYSAWFGLLMIAAPAALSWSTIRPDHWPLLALVGLAGTTGQFLMVGAFQVAEASALAPVDYIRLIFALIAGYVLFNEIPDVWTWIGAAIIIGSVSYAAHLDRRATNPTVPPVAEGLGRPE